jgi:hypothetical protein
MRKLIGEEILELGESNRGDIDRIHVPDDFDLDKCEISGTDFRGENHLASRVTLINSIIKDCVVDENACIISSTAIGSCIGKCCIVEGNSVVKESVLSPICVPVLQESGKREQRMFFVMVNNSQLDGDVVFGGSDLRGAKSRGGSLFAFAHLGGGEFTKNVIMGSQPEHDNSKTIVNAAHFGYYGKMIILGLAVYDKDRKVPDINSHFFFESYRNAFEHRYYAVKPGSDMLYEAGRVNLGCGLSMSDYDPIKDTKSGAMILLSHTGVNVTLPPYLTVLYHSLIANGSLDISKVCKNNVVPPGSLVSTRREATIALDGYYTENEPRQMNERCHDEMDFVVRYMRMLEAFSGLCLTGYAKSHGLEKHAWHKASQLMKSQAKTVNKRWLKAYFESLEKYSIPGLEARLKESFHTRLQERLDIQLALLERKSHFLSLADKSNGEIDKFAASIKPLLPEEMLAKKGQKVWVVPATEQEHQLKVSIISIPNEVEI